MNEPPVLVGMYSEEAAFDYGTTIWRTPEGTEVEITAAVGKAEDYKWRDAREIGKVIAFVRRATIGEHRYDEGNNGYDDR